jgi:RNA polymerase-binding transcription factor DksA
VVFVLLPLSQANANELKQLTNTSQEIIENFSSHLKKELQEAIQAGGPVNAIEVCNTRASEIAASLSQKGWHVGRTSLKVRNLSNLADEFEKKVLEDFERRKNGGHDIKQLAYYKMNEAGSQIEFRYMKAIPTSELCLTCHGNDIAEPVINKLDQLYPNDKARAYKQGDIRGAFTLRKVFQKEMDGDSF